LNKASIAVTSSKKDVLKIEKEKISGQTTIDSENFGHTWSYSIRFAAALKQ
jgi:hypothetical protein